MTVLIGVVLLLSNGCKRESPTNNNKDVTAQAAATPEHSPDHDHDHAGDLTADDDADDHAGHDHGEVDLDDQASGGHGNGQGHGGQRHELGSREIAGLTVEIAQFGAATGNVEELVFEIEVLGEPAPTAVRLLVRTPDGAESLKVKAIKVGDHEYDAHVGELPDQLGEGSVVVVEVETPSGTEELVFPLES